jgi:hypothetical protein
MHSSHLTEHSRLSSYSRCRRRKSTAGGGAACLVLVLAEGQVAGRGTTASARGEPAQRRCLLGSANLGVRGKHVIAAQRGVRRSAVSPLGSANLARSGLRRNGPSDTASHHRPEAIAVTTRCTPRKSQQDTVHLMDRGNKRARKESSNGPSNSASRHWLKANRSTDTVHPSQVACAPIVHPNRKEK